MPTGFIFVALNLLRVTDYLFVNLVLLFSGFYVVK